MLEPAQLVLARQQIEFSRDYTHTLIDDLEDDLWFVQPTTNQAGAEEEADKESSSGLGVTHIAWQIGHLAMAEYMLTLFRIRGKEPSDKELIDKTFMRCFLKGTVPEPDAKKYPAPAEILQVFNRVHEQVLKELTTFLPEELEAPVVAPFAVYPNRLGSLLFCASHEMLHAGQIGLIRRLLGRPPIR